MKEHRNYQRYVVKYAKEGAPQIEAYVDGEPVILVDYSLGGLFFLSKRSFIKGETVNILINLENRGNIALMGKVVRVSEEEGERWGTAIDLSHPYAVKTGSKL